MEGKTYKVRRGHELFVDAWPGYNYALHSVKICGIEFNDHIRMEGAEIWCSITNPDNGNALICLSPLGITWTSGPRTRATRRLL